MIGNNVQTASGTGSQTVLINRGGILRDEVKTTGILGLIGPCAARVLSSQKPIAQPSPNLLGRLKTSVVEFPEC